MTTNFGCPYVRVMHPTTILGPVDIAAFSRLSLAMATIPGLLVSPLLSLEPAICAWFVAQVLPVRLLRKIRGARFLEVVPKLLQLRSTGFDVQLFVRM